MSPVTGQRKRVFMITFVIKLCIVNYAIFQVVNEMCVCVRNQTYSCLCCTLMSVDFNNPRFEWFTLQIDSETWYYINHELNVDAINDGRDIGILSWPCSYLLFETISYMWTRLEFCQGHGVTCSLKQFHRFMEGWSAPRAKKSRAWQRDPNMKYELSPILCASFYQITFISIWFFIHKNRTKQCKTFGKWFLDLHVYWCGTWALGNLCLLYLTVL